MLQLVIFDGDDTLWSTEPLYDAARSDVRRLVEARGLDGARWEEVERERDVENVAVLGMSAARFPTSCVQALEVVGGRSVEAAFRNEVWERAKRVFATPALLLPGAKELLRALRATYGLVLLTKGDADVQQLRVDSSGLRPFFDRVEIVAEKTRETFSSVAAQTGSHPASSVSIGNSLRSDVLPALEAGMRAIWIDAHVWEWERAHSTAAADLPEGVLVADSLSDVPRILQALPAWA